MMIQGFKVAFPGILRGLIIAAIYRRVFRFLCKPLIFRF